MGLRIKQLLERARAWCDQPDGRGRRAMLARALGVDPSHISMWFSQSKETHPNREPTGEQALALESFLAEYASGSVESVQK